MTELIVAALIFFLPAGLHYSFLWGNALLEKVATPFPRFDEIYNQRPLLLSFFSGSFLTMAHLTRPLAGLCYILFCLGLAFAFVDFAAAMNSMVGHIKKRRS